MKNHNNNETQKYGNDEIYESPIDTYIFHPIGLSLVDPIYKLGLTPNQITIISTFFTFISCYLIRENKLKLAVIFYLSGYILDCVDGRLARKYGMGSKIGAALDMVSDVITNTVLLISILYYKKNFIKLNSVFILIICFIGLTICHGFTEAVNNYKKNGSDNFYKNIEKEYSCSNNLIYKLYIMFNKSSYSTYKCIIGDYDSIKIHNYIGILKYFGPGTFNIVYAIIILTLK
jgi:hypothetical protein